MALEIKAVPPAQLVNRLISDTYALNNAFTVDPAIEPLPKLLGDRLDVFIKTFELAFEQFRYALRTVIKATKDADSQTSKPDALHKPRGECEDAQRHLAKVRREAETVKLLLMKNVQDPKVAEHLHVGRQIDTALGYLAVTLDAARKQLDALDKAIRDKERDTPPVDTKADQELDRLQAADRSLQAAFQALDRVYQTQRLVADKARANRDVRAMSAAAEAVGKPLAAWQGLFKGSRAGLEDFKKRNSANKDWVAQADKLIAALDSMVNSVMAIVNWKGAMPVALARLDYGKWLKALKLDKSDFAGQLVVNFEYATRNTPVDTWVKAFDKIISSFEIPKARGSEWLSALLRAQLVPTFE